MLTPVEIWKALAGRIVATTAITALLGNGIQGVIYSEGSLPKSPVYPLLRLSAVTLDSRGELSALGAAELRWQLDIFGPASAVNWDLADRLETLLDVPRGNPAGITATGWRIRSNQMNSPVNVVGRTGLTQDGHDVLQLSMDWTLKAEST